MNRRIYKRTTTILLSFLLCITPCTSSFAKQTSNDNLSLSAASAILMEASTGTVCYAKNENTPLAMASVTKVMTLLLIMEAIDANQLQLNQHIVVSDHAASMGGSQVFLEPQEVQTVETLIKCISIASANDGAVAMAEAVSGSEEAFVEKMNEKAAALHMENTHFVNCCGLDAKGHFSCAKDLAIVTRELITKHPSIFQYCSIWQEDITHETRNGSTPFTLTNTNKLLKQYPYATGLKTGSTDNAKFCLSATAQKDDLCFIAVIMAAPSSKERIKDAVTLFQYGFQNTALYQDPSSQTTYHIPVVKGVEDNLVVHAKHDFSFLAKNGETLSNIQKKVRLPKEIKAPVKKGQKIGTLTYYIGDQPIGSVPFISKKEIPAATYFYYLKSLSHQFLMTGKK